jgi:carbamoyltransferase
MPTHILGLSAYYHDSAACLVRDGEIVAAAQQERFSRKKHDARFPAEASRTCLDAAGITLGDVDHVVFYDKPLIKFERLLETYLSYAPRGFRSFHAAMPVWLREKLFLKDLIRKELAALAGLPDKTPADALPPLLFTSHHQSHAASAFFPSPFERAAVLCMDGVGEWATTSVWLGEGNRLTPQWEIQFPHSLGLLYSAFTYFTGFKVNSGEYKLMGLAPYGEPKYQDLILDRLLALKDDGSFRMDMRYFNYANGLTMTNRAFDKLFGGPPRKPESPITQREMDLAASVQAVTEEVVLRLGRTVHDELGTDQLCLAGGVALNCVANGRLKREGPFTDIWVQPAAGDSGGALGAALSVWHEYLEHPRPGTDASADGARDQMRGAYLGPAFGNDAIERYPDGAASPIAGSTTMGSCRSWRRCWTQGRSSAGSRGAWSSARGRWGALHHRRPAQYADAVGDEPQDQVPRVLPTLRPGHPRGACVGVVRVRRCEPLHADGGTGGRAPPAAHDRRSAGAVRHRQAQGAALSGAGHHPRGLFGPVADRARRDQSALSQAHQQLQGRTGCPMLVNTSFNVRGEPIVGDPRGRLPLLHAHRDGRLVLENCLLLKADQPAVEKDDSWQQEFELD